MYEILHIHLSPLADQTLQGLWCLYLGRSSSVSYCLLHFLCYSLYGHIRLYGSLKSSGLLAVDVVADCPRSIFLAPLPVVFISPSVSHLSLTEHLVNFSLSDFLACPKNVLEVEPRRKFSLALALDVTSKLCLQLGYGYLPCSLCFKQFWSYCKTFLAQLSSCHKKYAAWTILCCTRCWWIIVYAYKTLRLSSLHSFARLRISGEIPWRLCNLYGCYYYCSFSTQAFQILRREARWAGLEEGIQGWEYVQFHSDGRRSNQGQEKL